METLIEKFKFIGFLAMASILKFRHTKHKKYVEEVKNKERRRFYNVIMNKDTYN